MTNKLLNLQVNWSEGVTERLDWKTTVSASPTGAEQRMAMLEAPRRSMGFAVMAAGSKRKSVDFFLSKRRAETFDVPIWFDYSSLTEDAAGGSSVILCDVDGHGLRAGTRALITTGTEEYEIVTIDETSSSSVTLLLPTVLPWPVGARIYPLREGRIKDKTSWSQHNSAVWTCRLEVEITEVEIIDPSWSTLVYTGYPVLTVLPNMDDALTVEIDRMVIDVDSGIGRPVFVETADVSFRTQTHSWLLRGAEQYADFRGFLQTAEGRLHTFWLPSFTRDFELTENVASSDVSLTVENCGYVANLWGDVNRRDLYILLQDGTKICRRISAAVEAGPLETLTLSSAVGTSFSKSDVALICLMSTARLDSDSIELFHPTDTQGATQATIPVRTVPKIRTSDAYDAMPFPDTVLRDYVLPPAVDINPLVTARIFWTTKFHSRVGNVEFPLRVNGTDYATGSEAVPIPADGLVEYTGDLSVSELYVELTATDEMGDPLPKDQQPKVWTPYPLYAQSQESVGLSTYKHFKPTYSPVYGGAHVVWGAALTGATVDPVVIRGKLPGTGEVRSFPLNYSRSSAVFGPHRHWRIVIPRISQDGVNVFRISEIEFRTAPGGASATTGGESFSTSGAGVGYESANVFDGNPATDWSPGGGTTGPWIGYSQVYGSEVDIVQVALKPSAASPDRGPVEGLVQYSDERGYWTDAWSFKCDPWSAGVTQVFTATFAYQKWLIRFATPESSANQALGPLAMSTLMLYDEIGGTDLALAATLTGATPLNGSVDVDKLNDGNDATYWSGHLDYQQFIIADLGTAKALIDVAFKARTDANANQAPTEAYIAGGVAGGTLWTRQWGFIGEDMSATAYGHTQNFPKSYWKNARRIMRTMPARHQDPYIRRAAHLTRINPSYSPAFLLEGAIGPTDKVYFEIEWTRIQNYLGDHRAFVGVTGPTELAANGIDRANLTMVNYRGYSIHNGSATDLGWTPALPQGGRMGVVVDRSAGTYKVRFGSAAFHADLPLGSAHATEEYLFAFFHCFIGFEDPSHGKAFMHEDEFAESIPSGCVALGTLGDGTPAAVRWDEKDTYGPFWGFGDRTVASIGYQDLDHNVFTGTIRANVAITGKKYFEVQFVGHPGARNVGISKRSKYGDLVNLGTDAMGLSLVNGNVYLNFGTPLASFGGALTGNGTVRVAVDESADLIWFAWNSGLWNNNGSADPASGAGGVSFAGLGAGAIYPAVSAAVDQDFVAYQVVKLLNGAACAYSSPSGFSALS
jgi:hypothetical protein